jgi:Contact-dependent growth inhibition CdiA C-terminal domain
VANSSTPTTRTGSDEARSASRASAAGRRAPPDGLYTEFKSLDPGASNKTAKSALKDAKGQAAHAVIDARDSGLGEEEAERGMRRFLGTPYGHRLDGIRIVGDNYEIDWRRRQ